MDYEPVRPSKRPLSYLPQQQKEDALYWRTFKNAVFIKNYETVTSLHFSASSPHRFAVTSGSKVQLYTPRTARVVKTISRFKDTARSGHIRDDGKLLVAGDDGGVVQVFDLASRAILRTIKDHTQPVHTALFSSHTGSTPQLLTTSDDTTVRTFDLSTAAPLSTFSNHDDYVRAGTFMPNNPALYLSGSYDSTVKLWDARSPDAQAATFEHGYPVECVLVHPSGTIALSAGGPLIKIWDLLSGSTKPLKALSNHQKTVTSLAWSSPPGTSLSSPTRLLSAGLDGLVKVYGADEGSWRVKHTMRYGFPLLSLAISPTDATLVVGGSDGTLAVRTKPTVKTKDEASRRVKALANRLAASSEPKEARPLEITYRSSTTQSRRKHAKLREWDRHLKGFRYADALDAVLAVPATPPKQVVAVLDELKRLDGLKQAMGGRNDVELMRILRFFIRTITDVRYGAKVSEFVALLIDLYDRILGQSVPIDRLFRQLQKRVEEEMTFQRELMQMQGALDMLFACNAS